MQTEQKVPAIEVIDYQPGVTATIKRKPYFMGVSNVIMHACIVIVMIIAFKNTTDYWAVASLVGLFYLWKTLSALGGRKVKIDQSGVTLEKYMFPLIKTRKFWPWSEIKTITTRAKFTKRGVVPYVHMMLEEKDKVILTTLFYLPDIRKKEKVAGLIKSVLLSFKKYQNN
jgi:hypothetical protein